MIVSTKSFSWDPKTQTLSAEMSDIRWSGNIGDQIRLTSHKTGKTFPFTVVQETRDREDELTDIVLRSPDAPGVRVILFND